MVRTCVQCAEMYKHMHATVCACMRSYIRTYVRMYVHTYVRTHIHTYMHTYIRTFKTAVHAQCLLAKSYVHLRPLIYSTQYCCKGFDHCPSYEHTSLWYTARHPDREVSKNQGRLMWTQNNRILHRTQKIGLPLTETPIPRVVVRLVYHSISRARISMDSLETSAHDAAIFGGPP